MAALAEQIAARRRIPSSTYRLQFGADFTFRQAREAVAYLAALGVSHVYASPLLKSRPGGHGYDICDPTTFDPRIGSEDDFRAFSDGLRAHGMGLILDVVPNHMGIGGECNRWWLDVLEHGPASPYAAYFDIEWHATTPDMDNKVLLPILGDQYGAVLESGKLRLAYHDGTFAVHYGEHLLPVAARTCALLLRPCLDAIAATMAADDEPLQDLQSVLTEISHLPPPTEQDAELIAEGRRESDVVKRRIAALYGTSAEFGAALDATVARFNGVPGDARSFDALDALLAEQSYRPAYWRVASEEINYRRFFDINELAAIRVEIDDVFRDTHELIFRMLADGRADGLRVDHPDGLRDPARYFERLQTEYVLQLARAAGIDAPEMDIEAWSRQPRTAGDHRALPLYVVAEKVLSTGEALDEAWAVHGTTGYDFLNAANRIFVDERNERSLNRVYGQFIGRSIDVDGLENSAKKMIMLVSFASEINTLAQQLDRIAAGNRRYRDFTLNSLTFALREIISCLRVYRTYIAGPEQPPGADDARYIEGAVEEAKRRNPRTAASIFDFVRDTLLFRNAGEFPDEAQAMLTDFVLRFQQITGPVMAKGVEDTAFYTYNRLVSLNEVGGDPERFGASVERFHDENRERLRRWPHSMLTTSTHDTKRGEDVRARIDVLSEMPDEWRAALSRWSRLNVAKKTRVEGALAPDRNDEYLLYQTLAGAWPPSCHGGEDLAAFRARIAAYMLKATKEAKVHTSWVNANETYDRAVQDFVRAILSEERSPAFIDDMAGFARRIASFGRHNSLSQLLLKLTSPGVPDLYQGSELWDLGLVDPDNRRPVDFALRRALLDEIGGAPPPALDDAGRVKLFVAHRALRLRGEQPQLFADGSYEPLEVEGAQREHVCAFARAIDGASIVVVVPRLVFGLTQGAERLPCGAPVWGDTHIVVPGAAGGCYANVFTSEQVTVTEAGGIATLPAAAVLATFPVALLVRV
jgi:(1->4)-alpha-D-glucan 1-alpha-D-glucosylmutase